MATLLKLSQVENELQHYRVKRVEACRRSQELHRWLMDPTNEPTTKIQYEFNNTQALLELYDDKIVLYMVWVVLAELRIPIEA